MVKFHENYKRELKKNTESSSTSSAFATSSPSDSEPELLATAIFRVAKGPSLLAGRCLADSAPCRRSIISLPEAVLGTFFGDWLVPFDPDLPASTEAWLLMLALLSLPPPSALLDRPVSEWRLGLSCRSCLSRDISGQYFCFYYFALNCCTKRYLHKKIIQSNIKKKIVQKAFPFNFSDALCHEYRYRISAFQIKSKNLSSVVHLCNSIYNK